ILDQHLVEPDDLVDIELVAPCLHDGAAPSLQPVARRTFAFNLEARAAVGQQHETRSSGDEMGAGATDGLARLLVERPTDEPLQRFGAAYDRTEAPRAQQVVADAVASR